MTQPPCPPGRRWLTTGQAAQFLGVDSSTVYRWAIKGSIPANAVWRSSPKRLRIASDWCCHPSAANHPLASLPVQRVTFNG
jgi:excisionase family DNA binding protein